MIMIGEGYCSCPMCAALTLDRGFPSVNQGFLKSLSLLPFSIYNLSCHIFKDCKFSNYNCLACLQFFVVENWGGSGIKNRNLPN